MKEADKTMRRKVKELGIKNPIFEIPLKVKLYWWKEVNQQE